MNLIDQIFIAIMFTLFSGALALVFWKLLEKSGKLRNPQIAYLLLRLVCILYVLPVGYILIQLTVRDGFIQTQELWQLNFHTTTLIKYTMMGIAVFWFFLLAAPLVKYNRNIWINRDVYGGTVPEDDDEVLLQFKNIQKQLGIHRKVSLCRNDLLAGPMIMGLFHCRIILPYRYFSREQLQVILTHELIHHKNHDLLFKLIAMYIDSMLIFFKKHSSVLEDVNIWSEYCCDLKTIKALRNTMDKKIYFHTIIDVMQHTLSKKDNNSIFSMLCEDELTLDNRIEFMQQYEDTKLVATGRMTALAAAFLSANISVVYVFGSQLAEINDYFYENSYTKTEEIITKQHNIPYIQKASLTGSKDNTYKKIEFANPEERNIMSSLKENQQVTFNWLISPHIRKISPILSMKKGQNIHISCSSVPEVNIYSIGIMNNSNNDVIYISGNGDLSYNFTVPSNGNYSIFVQNESEEQISAAGNYYHSLECP